MKTKMNNFFKNIILAVLLIIFIASTAKAAGELWYPVSGYLKPVSSGWGLEIPSLAGVGNRCAYIDANGKFAASAADCNTSSAHNLLSTTHGDTLADTVARGDVMVGNSTPKWSRLAFPASPTGKVLQATATDVAWSDSALGTAAFTASTAYLAANGKAADSDLLDSHDTSYFQTALTFGIADTNKVQINAADVADNDYAKFTTTGLEGRSYSELLSDIGGATNTLSNLGTVAINTTLASDTDNTDSLGTAAIGWSDLFLGNGSVITWSTAPSTADMTLTHSADTLTFAGGTVALGTGPTATSPVFTTDITTPKIITASGALTLQPASGSGATITLATTGDFVVNTDDLVVDTSAGRVGIGTTSPAQALDVNGYIHMGKLFYIDAASGNPEFDFQEGGTTRSKTYYDVTNNRLTFQNNENDNADALYFADHATFSGNNTINGVLTVSGANDSSFVGNVGIGVTAPFTIVEIQNGLTTTGAVLTLSSKETSTVANDILGRINFRAALDASGSDANLTGASIAAIAENTFSSSVNETGLQFSTAISGVATEVMRIDHHGKVGIGTTAPAAILEVQNSAGVGSLRVTANTSSYSTVDFYTGATYGAQFAYSSSDSSLQFWNYQNGPVLFASNNTERMRIAAAGTVTIANLAGSGSRTVVADANGLLSAPASDERLKKNITPIGSDVAMKMLSDPKIQAVNFQWKDEKKGDYTDLGFTAQMFEPYGVKGLTFEDNGIKGLNYEKITTLEWEQNKEQQKQIESLTERLNKLEAVCNK